MPPREPASARGRAGAAAAIVAVGAVLPAVVTAIGGGFGIPRNDDWAYLATVQTLADEGVFRLRGPAEMTLAAQIYLAWPIAKLTDTSTTALQLTTLVLGTAALFAILAVARTVLDLKRSVFVALAVAVTPLWPTLVTTFMTDVWAFSFGLFALLLVVRAVAAEGTTRFLAGLAAALALASIAVMIRQTASVALLAVVVAAAVALLRTRTDPSSRTLERTAAAGLVAVAAVGCAAFYRWRSTMPLGELRTVGAPTRAFGLVSNADAIGLTLALLLLPASAVFLRRDLVVRRVRELPRAAPVIGIAIGWLVLLKLAVLPIDRLTLYDYASRFGPSSYSGAQVKVAIVPWVPWALLLVAAAANLWALIVVLSGPALRRCGREQPVLLAVAVTMIFGTLAMFAVSWIGSSSRFDRYFLPIVPWAALLLAWVGVLEARAGAGPVDAGASTAALSPALVLGRARVAGLVALVGLAAWFGLASASYDRTALRAGEAARRQVGPVDAGWTVNGIWRTYPPADEKPITPSSSDCWTLHQAADRADVDGPVVLHDRLLWVDRWFYLVDARPGCGPDADLREDENPGGG